jgi:hypothetical protein
VDRAAVLAPFLPELTLDGPLEPFVVVADALQQHGDPWGEIIALSCQPLPWSDYVVDRWESLMRDHARELCPLFDEFDSHGVAIEWARGFVRSARFGLGSTPSRDVPDLLALPAAALITTINFYDLGGGDGLASVLLRHRDRLARVPRLHLGDNRFAPSTIADLRAALPGIVLRDH